MSRLAKLTDLFQEGTTVSLKTPTGPDVVVWINKLSPFEQEQSNHDGRIARARIMLAIREVGTAEYDLFRASAAHLPPEALIDALVAAKSNEHLVKVIHELHSDVDWKERLETLDWSGDQLKGKSDDDPEVAVVTKILREYQGELSKRQDYLADELRSELKALGEGELREQYYESYISSRGMAAFTREQQQAQVFYALRCCEGVSTRTTDNTGTSANVRWDHGKCDHSQRWLDEVSDVHGLPETLLNQVRTAYESLNMAPDVARFSAALGSSSVSPEPSSKQEDSVESGPEVTSEEPAGTSSSQ